MTMHPNQRLCVALDVPGLDAARTLAQRLETRAGVFKVGLELFTAHGPAAVEAARSGGAAVFLDLKVHDIPRTAAAAVASASTLGASYLTLHALGGPAMIRAARETAEKAGARAPRLLAVTVLTSHDEAELGRIGLAGSPADNVVRLAEMAIAAGAHGLVCSPNEAAALRRRLGPDAILVTPGIRPAGADAGDQARIATPFDAIRDGASLLVVGRPITGAADPADAADAILAEIAAAAGAHGR